MLAAVAQAGLALQYAVTEPKGDREIVLAAVAQKGWALLYAAAELKGDRCSHTAHNATLLLTGQPNQRGLGDLF